jgi:hypothetical protein
MKEGVRTLAERSPAMSAREWRAFWESRGMRELAEVASATWAPLERAHGDEREACFFRIASLLGSRASAKALADELARVRHELGEEPAALDDARAARAIATWFAGATRP